MFQICRLSAANTAPFEKFHMLVLLMQKYVFLALAYLRPQVLHHSSRLITNPHIQCLQYSNDLSCFKLLIWYFESSILCVMKNLSYFKFTLLVRQNEGQLVLIPYNWDQIKQAHLGKRNESRGARTMMQNTKCWRKKIFFETVTFRHRPAKTIWLICHLRPLPTICKYGK